MRRVQTHFEEPELQRVKFAEKNLMEHSMNSEKKNDAMSRLALLNVE